MTTEEAIEIITLMRDMARNSVSTNTSNADALDMAIRALKNEQTDGDLISRKAVLDTICSYGTELERYKVYQITVCDMKQTLCDLIEELPTIPQTAKTITIKDTELPQNIIDEINAGRIFVTPETIIVHDKDSVLEDIKAEIEKLPRIKVGNSNSPTVKYCIDERLIYEVFEKHISGKEGD